MKAKKPLIVAVLTLALLAVALILPAAASGAKPAGPGDEQRTSWVEANTHYRFSDGLHGTTVASVRKLADNSLTGQVVVAVLCEPCLVDGSRTWFKYRLETRAFTSRLFWDARLSPLPAHAEFFFAGKNNWPADLGSDPSWWSDYEGAAVADFIAYVPVSEYPESLPWVALYPPGTPSIPCRFMFIDSGKSGEDDLMLSWRFVGDPTALWYPTIWQQAPIHHGNVRVHVGN
jgi:hypothetical protein